MIIQVCGNNILELSYSLLLDELDQYVVFWWRSQPDLVSLLKIHVAPEDKQTITSKSETTKTLKVRGRIERKLHYVSSRSIGTPGMCLSCLMDRRAFPLEALLGGDKRYEEGVSKV